MSLPAEEPVITALVAERCPSCGARLGPAAQWCGLCFTDLRPAPAPAPSEVAPPGPSTESLQSREATPLPADSTPVAVPADPSGALGEGSTAEAPAATRSTAPGTTARPTWPCSGCGASVDVELDACPACGIGFLGALRSSSTGIEMPVVGDLGRFSARSRAVLAGSVGLAIAIILVLITALIGH